MRGKRLRVVALCSVTALVAGCGGTRSAEPKSSPTPAPAGTTEAQGPRIVSRSISETRTELKARADVAYPRFEGLADAKAQDAINQALEAEARKAVADFFTGLAGEPPYVVPGTSPDDPVNQSSLDGTFEKVVLDQRHASLRLFRTLYRAGAAHPGTNLITHSIDLETGRFFVLSDVFKRGTDHLRFLSEISRRLLAVENVGTEDSRIEGTIPEAENFAGWVLAGDGIEITFAQYQVASYAEGFPRILILRQAMGDLIADDGPLGYSSE